MLKVVLGLLVVAAVVVAGFSLIGGGNSGDVSASAQLIAPDADTSLFARADGPYAWDFPRDHGAHRAFQTEWWYYTGNVADAAGRRFGYQFTVFRRAIAPEPDTAPADDGGGTRSEFRTAQAYMAHFTVSDVAAQAFYHEQRFSRGAAGLAYALPDDAQPDAPYQVALEDWSIRATGDDAYALSAASGQGFAVDFTLTDAQGPALQGDGGLSPKSAEPGNASYYYSMPRLLTDGTIMVGGETFVVTGTTWMDHEFSTSALGTNAVGWDWFGLQLDDGRELMAGQIRLLDGGREPAFGGLLVEADGTTRALRSDEFTITPTGEWASPHTGATYPAGWTIEVSGDGGFSIEVTPLQPDQELHDSDPAYWEGAVAVSGDATGYGYAELTGYAQPMTRRF